MASNDILVTLRADMGDLQNSFKDLQNNLTSTEKSTEGLGSVLGKIGKIAGFALLGKQLIDLGKDIVSTGKNFESEMSKVSAISGATGNEFNTLTDLAKKLGSTTNFSASEASQGMQYLAMAGWKTKDIMAGLPAILDLATASGSDLARVSDIASDAMTGFGLDASQASHFADVLTYASSNANVNVELLGESFKYVAPLAGTTNQSMETLTGAISKLGDAGIKGSMAGTSLRAILNRLATTPKPVADAMGELGVAIYDNDGKMRNLNTIIGDLSRATDGMTDAEKNRLFTMIAGTEALSSLNVLMGVGEEGLNDFTNALENSSGSAKNTADIMNNNLNGSLKTLESKLEGVKIALYDKVKEPLKKIVDSIVEAIDWVMNLGNTFKENETTILAVGGAFTTLALGIGAFAVYLNSGALIGGLVSLGTTIMSVIKTVWALTTAFLSNPIGWITLAVMALVVGGVLLWKNWDKVKAKAQELWSAISNIWGNICKWTSSKWNNIKQVIYDTVMCVVNWVVTNWNILVSTITAVWTAISSACTVAWETIKNIVTVGIMLIVSVVEALFKLVTLPIMFVWENIKEYIFTAWEYIKQVVSDAINTVSNVITTIFNKIRCFIYICWEGIKSFFLMIWDGIVAVVKTYINIYVNMITTVFNFIKNIIMTIWNAISAFFTKVWDAIYTTVSAVATRIRETLTAVWNSIYSSISRVFNNIKSFIERIWNGICKVTTNIWDSMCNKVSGIANAIGSKVSTAFNSLKNIVSNIWDSIKNAMWKPIQIAKDKIANLVDGVKSLFNFNLEFPKPKLPHFSLEGKFSLAPPSVPHLNVDWHAKGGIFTRPTVIGNHGFGEAGKEAILPLGKLPQLIGMDKQQELMDKVLSSNAGDAGATTIHIEHFENNREQDVAQLAKELEYYRQRYNFAKGVR